MYGHKTFTCTITAMYLKRWVVCEQCAIIRLKREGYNTYIPQPYKTLSCGWPAIIYSRFITSTCFKIGTKIFSCNVFIDRSFSGW